MEKNKIYKLLRPSLRPIVTNLAIASIRSAIREQGLLALYRRLIDIVPDITHQYSNFKIDNEYIFTKVKAQHSFQISLANRAIELINNKGNEKELKIVDIGDSAGTHLQYIKALWSKQQIRTVSINLDNNAVQRIRQKGLEAICCRAEDIDKHFHNGANIFLSFEVIEHLMNPIRFLHNFSKNNSCKFFIITVPYLRHSRLGLHQVRNNTKVELNAENTHILELSPDDWRLLFRFSGWQVNYDAVYLQYPRRHPLNIMKFYWKKFDFEGFYGAILTRDHSWCDLYNDW